MEVIALRGRARDIRELANARLSLKGVKHGKLLLTLSARDIVARRKTTHSHAHHKNKPPRRAK